MDSGYQIRDAIHEDVDKLLEMRLSLQNHMSESNSFLWQMSQKSISEQPEFYRDMIKDKDAKLIVIQDNKTESVIGMGLGRKVKHDGFIPAKSGRIDDVWINPLYRKQGLCKRIMSELLGFFGEDGIDSLVLEYSDGNQEAKNVWEKHGFKDVLNIAVAKFSVVKKNCIKKI